jgi:sugar transferase
LPVTGVKEETLQQVETFPLKVKKPQTISPFVLGLGDFFLLNMAFFILNWWKRGSLDLNPAYFKLLLISYVIWLVVALFTKKFRVAVYRGYWDAIFLFGRSGMYAVYAISFVVVSMGLSGFSRVHVLGVWCLLVIQEWLFFSLYYALHGKSTITRKKEGFKHWEKSNPSRFVLVSDFLLLVFSFFIVKYLKTGHLYLPTEYEHLLFTLYGLWFVCSMITRKFEKRRFKNYYHFIWPWVKTCFLMVFGMSVIVFAFRFFYFSRLQAFGSILLLLFFEIVLCRVYYKLTWNRKIRTEVSPAEKMALVLKQRELPVESDLEKLREDLFASIRVTLKEEYLRDQPDCFEFLDQTIPLKEIVRAETTIRNNTELLRLDMSTCRPVRLFINMRRINGVGWIDQYFQEVHRMLLTRGYFVGSVYTIRAHRKEIFRKYPKYIAYGVYVIDFIMNRLIPKLPYLKNLYFAVTKGKHRVISKAQVLGRLCFCGFEIIAEKEIQGRLCFVCRKAKTRSVDQTPSYGPLVELKRIGANDEVLRIYKFRTMHPYSEFLQDYVFEKEGLKKGGKLENDFRVTEWGKIMRRLWLDELPMLYNWISGDLQLFGVRPLSAHYLSLYPKDLRELRRKVKPGLVPPFYADMPGTFSEICRSEKRYIRQYLKRPFRTQWVYFWRAVYNIVVRGARSN